MAIVALKHKKIFTYHPHHRHHHHHHHWVDKVWGGEQGSTWGVVHQPPGPVVVVV
jgi:hypothetical protein